MNPWDVINMIYVVLIPSFLLFLVPINCHRLRFKSFETLSALLWMISFSQIYTILTSQNRDYCRSCSLRNASIMLVTKQRKFDSECCAFNDSNILCSNEFLCVRCATKLLPFIKNANSATSVWKHVTRLSSLVRMAEKLCKKTEKQSQKINTIQKPKL
jgi:hypothetical protein